MCEDMAIKQRGGGELITGCYFVRIICNIIVNFNTLQVSIIIIIRGSCLDKEKLRVC